ncbi:MAG: hypothetical protein HBSAPP02_07880 [Phycisphaerae bacterium]|nr:MAG: hypothetical protein HRU71_00390 [Planctomycetia bacterium]GJQ25756.1 MAG: hypothetical protein HBSAPP02_07880 [Phycisphaerae bacterium]
MDSAHNKLQALLGTLGEAREAGCFAAAAGFPWQSPQAKVTGLLRRRMAWVRVGLPLAAAAAVAVLFVGPSLVKTVNTVDRTSVIPTGTQPLEVAELATAGPAATSAMAENCDYNGDGVVDGRDIQAFIDRLRDGRGDPQLEAEALQRCLLGRS